MATDSCSPWDRRSQNAVSPTDRGNPTNQGWNPRILIQMLSGRTCTNRVKPAAGGQQGRTQPPSVWRESPSPRMNGSETGVPSAQANRDSGNPLQPIQRRSESFRSRHDRSATADGLITAAFLMAHAITQVGIYGFGADKHWLDASTWTESSTCRRCSARAVADGGHVDATIEQAAIASAGDWTLLSRIFVFLALDEALQIHEILIIPGLRHQVHPALASTWVVPYAGSPSLLEACCGAFGTFSPLFRPRHPSDFCGPGASMSLVLSAWK